jgi:hypothetical protein
MCVDVPCDPQVETAVPAGSRMCYLPISLSLSVPPSLLPSLSGGLAQRPPHSLRFALNISSSSSPNTLLSPFAANCATCQLMRLATLIRRRHKPCTVPRERETARERASSARSCVCVREFIPIVLGSMLFICLSSPASSLQHRHRPSYRPLNISPPVRHAQTISDLSLHAHPPPSTLPPPPALLRYPFLPAPSLFPL